MSSVVIIPIDSPNGEKSFRAISSHGHSEGSTAGQALDALGEQPSESSGTIIVVQSYAPDRFFSAEQRDRLSDLMQRWRAARDTGASFPPAEQAELETLVQQEFAAAIERSRCMVEDARG